MRKRRQRNLRVLAMSELDSLTSCCLGNELALTPLSSQGEIPGLREKQNKRSWV